MTLSKPKTYSRLRLWVDERRHEEKREECGEACLGLLYQQGMDCTA